MELLPIEEIKINHTKIKKIDNLVKSNWSSKRKNR